MTESASRQVAVGVLVLVISALIIGMGAVFWEFRMLGYDVSFVDPTWSTADFIGDPNPSRKNNTPTYVINLTNNWIRQIDDFAVHVRIPGLESTRPINLDSLPIKEIPTSSKDSKNFSVTHLNVFGNHVIAINCGKQDYYSQPEEVEVTITGKGLFAFSQRQIAIALITMIICLSVIAVLMAVLLVAIFVGLLRIRISKRAGYTAPS